MLKRFASIKYIKTLKSGLAALLLFSLFLLGFPSQTILDTLQPSPLVENNLSDQSFEDLLKIAEAGANNFYVRTGYYVGDGGTKSIEGLGFNPQAVIVKADDVGGTGAILKTNVMPSLNVAYLSGATADNTGGAISLVENGFEVSGTLANATNSRFTWIAFSGSDCSAGSNFCIGSYTGNGTSPRALLTGFQPDMVLVKAATAVAPNWRSSAMPVNNGQYLTAVNQETTGALYTSLNSDGFTVGATNNTNAVVYYYLAFQNTAGVINVGSHTGTGVIKNVTGMGMKPDFLLIKNANATTPVGAVFNTYSAYGDSSSYFTDTADVVGAVTGLINDGFSVGANSTANGSTNTLYYAGFYGGVATTNSSGTYQSMSGSYVGTGVLTAINNLGFEPDLVVIKGATTTAGVFRTRMIGGDSTCYLDAATANFAGGITSLNAAGFTVGTNATVNAVGLTYYWTAYGNAWRPEKNAGASDFYIGAYYGNGVDSRNIAGLPYAVDMVTIKRNGATGGTFRTSLHSGDSSSYFAATVDAVNNVQVMNSDGFQVGTNANVNTAANLYFYFAFKNGSNFSVGTYSGTGVAKDVSVGWQPSYVWVKQTGAVRGVSRNSTFSGNGAIPFINVAAVTNTITGFTADGFSIGTAAETNTSGTNNYRYVAWRDTNTPTTPTFAIRTGYYVGDGGAKSIEGLGFNPQAVIIKADDAGGTGAILKTNVMPALNVSYLGAATADDAAGAVALKADGFEVVGALTNTVNSRYTWVALAGSDCSASGNFCIGSYTGNAVSPRALTIGFQPDLVLTKAATAVAPNWRSSAMPLNYAQFLAATAQEITGALYTSLDPTGYTVGATNNATTVVYYYLAFKNTAGVINVGSHTGTGVAKDVTGMGMTPDFLLIKNANATTAVGAVYNSRYSYGNSSSYFTDTANLVGSVTGLINDGFSVGTHSTANGGTNTIYYAGFNGNYDTDINSSGTFTIARGSYVGTGVLTAVNNLGFEPDLVIIKGNTTQAGIFRTRMMGGDVTNFIDSASTSITGAITSLNAAGFTVGTHAAANSAGITYYWTAYGNGWRPEKNSGAADFFIGEYYGNGTDNRNIVGLPFSADLVSVKHVGTTGGTFRTSLHSGDSSSFFAATADTANNIQVLNSDGFQIGTAANVNTAAGYYNYFGFKSGTNFTLGTYSGTGVAKDVTVGWQPDLLWVKQTGAVRGVLRHAALSGDSALPFINVAAITNAITNFISNGFSVGTAAETNTSGTNNYRFLAWRMPDNGFLSAVFQGAMNSSGGIPSAAQYLGSALNISRSSGSETVTAVTVTETGTVNADANLSNLTLKYDTDNPCAYNGDEATFGTASSFSSQRAVVSGSVSISSANQTCFYPLVTIGLGAGNGETVAWSLNASTDITSTNGYVAGSFPSAPSGTTTLTAGSLSVDIVDDTGNPVTTPTLAFSPLNFAFTPQTATGTLGTTTQKIRVENNSGNTQWSLSLAASNSNTSLWTSGANYYDYNDATSGTIDGADTDAYGGQMGLDPSTIVITPKSGCNNTGINAGSSASFTEGSLDSLTLVSANSSAASNCYWDISGISVNQNIPSEQATSNYSLPMTLTITAI